jgi:hypothetical protein
MEETRKAKSAIGPWQDNDEDELKQQIVDTECHLVAARHALQQAKALYDALPADLRKTEGLQSGFRIIDDSFVGAFANLDYIAAVLKMQREACQQP